MINENALACFIIHSSELVDAFDGSTKTNTRIIFVYIAYLGQKITKVYILLWQLIQLLNFTDYMDGCMYVKRSRGKNAKKKEPQQTYKKIMVDVYFSIRK